MVTDSADVPSENLTECLASCYAGLSACVYATMTLRNVLLRTIIGLFAKARPTKMSVFTLMLVCYVMAVAKC